MLFGMTLINLFIVPLFSKYTVATYVLSGCIISVQCQCFAHLCFKTWQSSSVSAVEVCTSDGIDFANFVVATLILLLTSAKLLF